MFEVAMDENENYIGNINKDKTAGHYVNSAHCWLLMTHYSSCIYKVCVFFAVIVILLGRGGEGWGGGGVPCVFKRTKKSISILLPTRCCN